MSSDNLDLIANFGAEQAALGTVLTWPETADEVFKVAPPSMFSTPKHGDIAAVIDDIRHTQTVDPQVVLSELMSRGLAAKVGGGPYLHTLMTRAYLAAAAPRHAQDVRDAWRRRTLLASCERAMQQLESPQCDMPYIVGQLSAGVDEALDSLTPVRSEPSPSVTDLLAVEETYDWLIPGLLERGDRLMLTGAEGHGKTVCLRMMAVCAAAGLHPFTAKPIDPVSVLVIDCENSPNQNRRGYRPIVSIAERMRPGVDWGRLRIEIRRDGLQLTRPEDVNWLDGVVQRAKPDLLIIGPLYKMHAENINDEQAARALAQVIDSTRVRHNCAVLIEAHAGHVEDSARRRKMRPTGSSLFMRWPEFGYGLRRSELDTGTDRVPQIVDVVAWRGARDEREWPEHLIRGWPGTMPWRAYDASDPTNVAARESARMMNGRAS